MSTDMAHMGDIGSFVRRLGIFLLPLAALLIFPVWVLYMSGEFVPDDRIMTLSKSDSALLVGKAYVPQAPDITLRLAEARRPEVLALGNSRVLEFRSEMFVTGTSFYNAGSTVGSAEGFRHFLQKMEKNSVPLPKIVIAGLDQTFFHPMWTKETMEVYENAVADKRPPSELLSQIWKTVYADYFHGKFTIRGIMDGDRARAVGLTALVRSEGFRSDGSYRYGRALSRPHDPADPDFGFKDTLERIREGNRRFEYASSTSRDAIAEINDFLDFAKSRRIEVVGFIPPYPHRVVAAMAHMDGDFSYMAKIAPELSAVFAAHGYSLLDSGDLRDLGARDDEAVDGFHIGEKATGRLLVRLAGLDPDLARLADVSLISARLKTSRSDYALF